MEDLITKYSTTEPQLSTEKDRTFTYRFSDSSVDLVGDSVDPKGIDTSRWDKNPVICFSHDTNKVVARGSNLRIKDNALYGDITFPPEGTSVFSDECYRLVEAGFLKGISISFTSLKSEYAKNRKSGRDFSEVLLLEASICAVPMNENTLIQAAKSQNLDVPELEKWFGDQWKTTPEAKPVNTNAIPLTEAQLLMSIQKVLKTAEKALAKIKKDADDADVPEDKDDGMDEQTLSLHKALAHLQAMKSLSEAHDDHRDQLEECLAKAIGDPEENDKPDAADQPKGDDDKPEDDAEKAVSRIRARVGIGSR